MEAADMPKRKRSDWTEDAQMQQLKEKKRRLEEAEPYNEASTRRKAKEVAMEAARRSSASEISRM